MGEMKKYQQTRRATNCWMMAVNPQIPIVYHHTLWLCQNSY